MEHSSAPLSDSSHRDRRRSVVSGSFLIDQSIALKPPVAGCAFSPRHLARLDGQAQSATEVPKLLPSALARRLPGDAKPLLRGQREGVAIRGLEGGRGLTLTPWVVAFGRLPRPRAHFLAGSGAALLRLLSTKRLGGGPAMWTANVGRCYGATAGCLHRPLFIDQALQALPSRRFRLHAVSSAPLHCEPDDDH